jgi:hypothetical protein
VFSWPLINQAVAMAGGVLVAGTVVAWQRRTRGACANCGRSDETQRKAPRWDRLAVGVAIAVPSRGSPGCSASRWVSMRPCCVTFTTAVACGQGPRWLPVLGGRRVPIRLAVVPATLVSIAVTSGGLGTLAGTGELLDGFDAEPWLVIPHLLWLVWGVALGAATCAYWLRRRGRCARCGRS